MFPINRFGNLYVHHFLRSDDDRALHDHPRPSLGLLLFGSYLEHLADGQVILRKPWRPWAPWRITFRWAAHAHRVALLKSPDGEELKVWTLFLVGPKVREWGFYCPNGWKHWMEYTNPDDSGATIGRGCDD